MLEEGDAAARTSIRPIPSSTTRPSAPASCATFERGSATPAGYVLPLQRWARAGERRLAQRDLAVAARQAVPDAGRFAARLRACRSARCRYVEPSDYPHRRCRPTRSPSARVPLPAIARHRAPTDGAPPALGRSARRQRQAARPVRTALAVEPRDGTLCVFMPPVEQLEDYLELLAAVEATAAELDLPVQHRRLPAAARSAPQRHQGHARSRRHRGQHPSGAQLARGGRRSPRRSTRRRAQCRLGADKFMIDGRHTGTGGGNHVVLGGATPADSPFLRRPDLLKSLVALLAAPSVAVLSVLRPVHRPDQPGAARRRGAPRRALRAGDRARAGARRRATASAARRGWSTGCSATCWSTSPATPIAPRSASTSCSRPTARPAGSAWSNSASFEMPPRRAHEPGAAAAAARAGRLVLARAAATARWCAGAPRCTTASCCRISSGQDFLGVLADLRARRLRASIRSGSRRSANSASRSTARSTHGGVELELRHALEPWHVLGEEGVGRRHRALRRFLGRAAAGEGRRASTRRATSIACNGRARAAAPDRPLRRVRRRRALQGLEARRRRCIRPSPCTRR